MNIRKRLRFTSDDDIILLREIVSNNPLENLANWKHVQMAVEKITTGNLEAKR